MHHLQDFILTVGTLAFIVALIPTIRSSAKPALSTSLLTLGVLLIFSAVYASLGLWFSAATAIANGACWLILAVQKLQQIK